MLEQRHATCIEEKWMLIAAVKVNGLPSEFRSAEEIYRQRWKSFHLHQLRNSKAVDSHKVRLIGPFVFLVSSLAVFRPRLLASGWMFTEGAKETERRARDKERVQRWINYREAHAQRGTENEKKKNEREKHKRNEKSLSSYSPRGGWVHTGGSATGHVVASCNSPAHEYKIIRNTWRFVACVYPPKNSSIESFNWAAHDCRDFLRLDSLHWEGGSDPDHVRFKVGVSFASRNLCCSTPKEIERTWPKWLGKVECRHTPRDSH